MLSKCVCTTRHYQTSGQLVQELNVSTVSSWAWMISQLNVALIRKLRGLLMWLASFWHVIHGWVYNQALAGAWSTGAVIKCRSCIIYGYTLMTKDYFEKYLTESYCSCWVKQFFFKCSLNIALPHQFCSKLTNHMYVSDAKGLIQKCFPWISIWCCKKSSIDSLGEVGSAEHERYVCCVWLFLKTQYEIYFNPYGAGGYFGEYEIMQNSWKIFKPPCTWVLIWEFSARPIQWVP